MRSYSWPEITTYSTLKCTYILFYSPLHSFPPKRFTSTAGNGSISFYYSSDFLGYSHINLHFLLLYLSGIKRLKDTFRIAMGFLPFPLLVTGLNGLEIESVVLYE